MLNRRDALLAAVLCIVPLLACKKSDEASSEQKPAAAATEVSKITASAEGVPLKTFEVKSGHTYASTKTFTSADGKSTHARIVSVYLANEAIDPEWGARTMGEPPKSADGIKVQLSLVGTEGTEGKDSDAPPETGKYTPDADKFMAVQSVGVSAGGKKHWLGDDLQGSVEITSAGDGRITGTVDLKNEKGAIKGSFGALLGKGPKK